MDRRERMAREKRAKAKAGRAERVQRRRKALDESRNLAAARRQALALAQTAGASPEALAVMQAGENDSQVNAQGEVVS